MKNPLLVGLGFILLILMTFPNCTGDKKTTPPLDLSVPLGGTFQPERLPETNPNIPGWKFPEDSATIDKWISTNDYASINRHAWGVWDALTTASKEHYNDQKLLIFETWYTPEDVQSIMNGTDMTKGRPRANFQALHQIAHGLPQDDPSSVVGFVKWSPTASDHIITNKLLYQSVLKNFQSTMDGKNAKMIPEFPNRSVALKPVYKLLRSFPTVKPGVYQIPVWPGTPAQAKPFGSNIWKNYAFVDSNNANATQSTATTSDSLQYNAAATYGLGDFIHYTINQKMADEYNSENPSVKAQAGDVFILVAMHITTKETKRWTWQSMYWTPNPAQPLSPSSPEIGAQRPAKFNTPEAGHYAMTVAYAMVNPVQPYTGGSGKNATSIYAFNPYLEAGFTPSDLPISQPVGKANNIYGVQSNCMSCHAFASWPGVITDDKNGDNYYSADRYVDMMQDTVFTRLKNLQVDFLWSIQGNVMTNK